MFLLTRAVDLTLPHFADSQRQELTMRSISERHPEIGDRVGSLPDSQHGWDKGLLLYITRAYVTAI